MIRKIFNYIHSDGKRCDPICLKIISRYYRIVYIPNLRYSRTTRKGNELLFLKTISIIILLGLLGCKVTPHNVIKHNYFNEDYFYNDSLKVSIDFWSAIEFANPKKLNKLNIKLKKYKCISKKQILLAGNSKVNNYQICIFYDLIKKPEDNFVHQKSILEDTIHKISIFEKYKGTQKIIVYVKSFEKNNKYATVIANDLLSKITIDGYDSSRLSGMNIFNNYSGKNSLQARKKIITEPTEKIVYKGLKWQLLAITNSFMSNNYSYDTLISNYEKKRKEKYNFFINGLSAPDVYLNNNIFEEIKRITKGNSILILNEDHYYPKHRIFGMELLGILKANGYKYISLEAFKIDDRVTFLPNKNNGTYINERYFAHFIRKAKELGFVILGHENYDDKLDRELGQARNLIKILKSDPDAKIFVYVGHSHLEEENIKKKWMAQYFKELSGINPVTINQVAVCADTNQELILIPRSHFTGNLDTKSSADYFLVNNIKPRLRKIYTQGVFKNVKIESKRFKEYKNQEVLVEVIDFNEWGLIKESVIPIEKVIAIPKRKIIELNLPVGKYHVLVKTEDNSTIYDNDLTVK